MLINKKADVKKRLAAKLRRYTPLAIASAASAISFTLFGTSIKPIVTPAPAEALIPISVALRHSEAPASKCSPTASKARRKNYYLQLSVTYPSPNVIPTVTRESLAQALRYGYTDN